MFIHKHVRATILLTMLAVVVAIVSLNLRWYQVTKESNTTEFGLTYFVDNYGMSGYDSEYTEVHLTLLLSALFVAIWFLLAIAYVGLIIPGEGKDRIGRTEGTVLGWVLLAESWLTVIVFAVYIAHAYNTDMPPVPLYDPHPLDSFAGDYGLKTWGPMAGWYVAIIACIIQSIAVLTRNLPALLGKPEDSGEPPPDEMPHGDLPIR
ncbi:MAG: hypothetical protein JSV94_06355 [Methanobacteriota archaeon]|nr:MAG: hypothetical protein JSV94_06355 [Euryarchaeota archaeon]